MEHYTALVWTLLLLGTGHRGVAGDVHGEDEQHAEVGQDVAADVEDAGVVPVQARVMPGLVTARLTCRGGW